ncbi:MAG: integrase [Acidimicrobiia bacterium]|nr:integrase [Acidimicrobiia bacterium]
MQPVEINLVPQATSDDQLIALWLQGRSPHTQRAYEGDIRRLRRIIPKPLAALTLADLHRFTDSLASLQPSSRYRVMSAVKSLLAFGLRIGYLSFDAGSLLRLPPVASRLAERILEETEVRAMLHLETKPRNRLILTLLYATGIRVSELCGLRWRHLQLAGDTAQITVTGKGGAARSIRLPVSVWELLRTTRGDAMADQPLFAAARGSALRPLTILRIVRAAALRAGITAPVSPHWFRHAHASHALDRGAPLHLVQATLGHASLTTTGRYLHARPQDSSGRFLGL